ncbi:MAG: Pr6Pr family membrane protein [Treponema sp.]|jgi:hypothetical protein|nr:Pr6Pr family membrane protein [Treponema sp.]
MIHNPRVVLICRILLLLLSLSAVVLCLFFPIHWQDAVNAYVIEARTNFWALSTFTMLSNIAVLIFYAAAVVLLIPAIKKTGLPGETVALPRLQSCICNAIFFTMVIYWLIIADWNAQDTFTYTNLCLHLVIPLGFIADYILFRFPGRMRKIDILFTYLSALLYFIVLSIMGAFHLHDYYRGTSRAPLVNWWPYGFLNYDALGIMPVFIVLGIGMVYLGFSIGLYLIDRRKARVIVPR